MNPKEIIESGESEITEFKTSLAEWRDVVETVSAFSNRSGGRVFIGVALVWQIIVTLLELISARTQSRNWQIRSSRIQTR